STRNGNVARSSPGMTVLRGGYVLFAELAAKAAELLLLSGSECGHELGDGGGVLRKEPANECLTFGVEREDQHAAIFGRLLTARQALLLQVASHHGEVAAGGQDLLGDVGERHGAEVVKGLEHGELS